MPPVATATTTATTATPPALKLRAEGATSAYPELERRGWTVVPGVIAADKAQHYVDEMYKWLESLWVVVL